MKAEKQTLQNRQIEHEKDKMEQALKAAQLIKLAADLLIKEETMEKQEQAVTNKEELLHTEEATLQQQVIDTRKEAQNVKQ